MIFRKIAIATLAVAATVPASAAPNTSAVPAKTTEKITCREFIALRDEFKPQIVSYTLGYDRAKRPDAAFIDVSGVDKIVPVLVSACRAKPEQSLLQRIRASLHRL